MSRLQLALNVADLDASIDFYRDLFDTEPHKLRDGYANFEIANPPLKLVLIQNADRRSGVEGALNHLGIEVTSSEDVIAATRRLTDLGHDTRVEEQTTCCHAVQDKVWTDDPADVPWEVYVVTDDEPADGANDGTCCVDTVSELPQVSACC